MSPVEAQPLARCPFCNAKPFYAARRWQVRSFWRMLFHKPYCAVICSQCGQIVGYEKPETKVKSSH
jgi:hypothetical protein